MTQIDDVLNAGDLENSRRRKTSIFLFVFRVAICFVFRLDFDEFDSECSTGLRNLCCEFLTWDRTRSLDVDFQTFETTPPIYFSRPTEEANKKIVLRIRLASSCRTSIDVTWKARAEDDRVNLSNVAVVGRVVFGEITILKSVKFLCQQWKKENIKLNPLHDVRPETFDPFIWRKTVFSTLRRKSWQKKHKISFSIYFPVSRRTLFNENFRSVVFASSCF